MKVFISMTASMIFEEIGTRRGWLLCNTAFDYIFVFIVSSICLYLFMVWMEEKYTEKIVEKAEAMAREERKARRMARSRKVNNEY